MAQHVKSLHVLDFKKYTNILTSHKHSNNVFSFRSDLIWNHWSYVTWLPVGLNGSLLMSHDPPLLWQCALQVLRALTHEGMIHKLCLSMVFRLDQHWFNVSIMMAMDNCDVVQLIQQKIWETSIACTYLLPYQRKNSPPFEALQLGVLFAAAVWRFFYASLSHGLHWFFIFIYMGQCTKATTSGQWIFKLMAPALFYTSIPTWHAFCLLWYTLLR